jgi:hypothetical protein
VRAPGCNKREFHLNDVASLFRWPSRFAVPAALAMTIAAIVMSLGQGFTHGFDISGGTIASVGFTGSAQTGYSANARIGFDFNQNGTLCGNNGPPNYAGQYVAHA